jgi:hypothetical protein
MGASCCSAGPGSRPLTVRFNWPAGSPRACWPISAWNLGPPGRSWRRCCSPHAADLRVQDYYKVNYLKYWVDDAAGKVFCLVEAPDAESAARVHREAHGLVVDRIFAVEEGA